MTNKDSQWDKESWLKEELEFWWLMDKKLSESEEMDTEKESQLEDASWDKTWKSLLFKSSKREKRKFRD